MEGLRFIHPRGPAEVFPARRRWCDQTQYLYLVAFPDKAKVGVTGRLRDRLCQLRRDAGQEPLWAVYMELHTWSARTVENLISRAFGGPTGTKGRASEWFAGHHVDAALRMMCDPAVLGEERGWRRRKREMADAA